MTYGHDPRDDKAPAREQTPEEREAVRKLETDAELRQLATDVLLTHENPQDYVRQDLQLLAVEKQGRRDRLTNVGAAAIAERIMEDRATLEKDLHAKALQAYAVQPTGKTYVDTVTEHLKAQDIEPDFSIPTFMGTERLQFERVATVEDIARAGATQKYHHELLKQGVPLQHKANMNLVIGAAPGDMQRSTEDYAARREASQFEGCAVYKIVKD